VTPVFKTVNILVFVQEFKLSIHTHFPENIWFPCSCRPVCLRGGICGEILGEYWSRCATRRPIDPPPIRHLV
jgi:hypothetical protein